MKRLFITIMIAMPFILPIHSITAIELPDIKQIEPFHQEASIKEMKEDLPSHINLDDPLLRLVNPNNPVLEQPWPELATIDGYIYFDVKMYNDLLRMIEDATYEGHYLRVISGFRTMEEQANNRMARYNSYINAGYSEGDAQYLVDLFYAQPDASEHLTGLAVDILGSDWTRYGGDLHQDYQYEASAQWLAHNAHRYGFILRYMQGKQEITGIEFEPWHFRYVGHEHAQYMYKYGITLEEYLVLLTEK